MSRARDADDLKDRVDAVLNPEPDPDMERREVGHDRLEKHHNLDLSYLNSFAWEGSTIHPHTRICSKDDTRLHALTRNSDVATRLFEAALRLFGDSILVHHGEQEHEGRLRFYPPILLTFWGGFETYVRYASELLLITVPTIPEPVVNFLSEQEVFVDPKGTIRMRTRYQPVLDRFAVLLKYGYGFDVDRGAKWWQQLVAAKDLRDYYTHLDMQEARALSSDDVIRFLEAVLVGLIYPSAQMKRTLHIGVFNLYWQWAGLAEIAEPYVEQPFFKDFYLKEGYMFHCNFENVDRQRFPNSQEEREFRERIKRMAADAKDKKA